MNFLDSWTKLDPLHLLRLLAPAAFLLVALFVPGRRAARASAVGLAIAVLFLAEIGPLWPIGIAWAVLWTWVAWRMGVGLDAGHVSVRPGGAESGAVGLLLGSALLILLVAAVARQHLPPEEGRRASYGLLLMCLGLLHLMLRRDALRAMVAFATLGLGLQVVEHAARHALVSANPADPGAALLATAVSVTLVEHLARARERAAGSAWVSEAHDLHD